MSKRALNIIGILILMGITAAISIFAYIYLVGGSGEATAPLSAPTLDLSTATPNAAQTQIADLEATNAALSTALAGASKPSTDATVEATTAAIDPTVAPTTVPATETTPEATAAVDAAAAAQVAAAAQAVAGGTLYRIDTAGSKVSFTLTEELRGTPTTVVGITDQVAGDIFVDFANPANSKMGVIRINARTLETDQSFRNRAIRSEILQSAEDKYQFIDFTPTSITGLPDKVEVGSTIKFQVIGDLKIRDIVQSVTFDVSVTATADSVLGSATAKVTRTQFDLQIPNVPGVANVSDDVTLDIKFTAPKVTGDASAAPTTVAEATVAPTVVPTVETTPEPTAAQDAAATTASLYRMDTAGSKVSFTLTEDLRGTPTTVVGITDQVAGDIYVDFANPANSKMGVIRINARTLETDQEFRNRAIRSRILQSAEDQYQFIDFTPTSITGLPDKVEVGATIKFQVIGDLKIRDIVQSVTFDVSVTATADTLTGSATTKVTREQYNLQIPNAPGVANVSNDVTLDIQFAAPKVAQ